MDDFFKKDDNEIEVYNGNNGGFKRKATGVSARILTILLIVSLIAVLVYGYVSDNNNSNLDNGDILLTTDLISLQPYSADAVKMEWEDVAEQLIPSVVCIISYTATSTSTGSGIIIDSRGYIVTNNHVVEGATKLDVVLYDDTIIAATIVGLDPYTDLAVIKITTNETLKVAVLGNSNQLRIAQGVMAIGNPGGLEFKSSVTIGYVSSLNRPIDINNGYIVKCIQTDAAINPGNSGGPLVNQYGQVIGVNSSKIVATGYEGMGFAISTAEAINIINNLMEYGKVVGRAALGIQGGIVSNQYVYYYNYPNGLIVSAVSSQKAINAGLLSGDIITEIEGKTVETTNTINNILQTKKPGDKITIKIYRITATERNVVKDGEYKTLQIELVEL